jgi:ribosome-binding factor A
MAVNRITRVNELVLRELGNIFTAVVSPAKPGCLITVTGVKMSVDLRDANVFVSIYGKNAKADEIMAFLERQRALIQSELARKVILKNTPRLHFKLDETAANADRVMAILHELDLDDQGTPKPSQTP